jgi:cardiolipin synthase
MVVPVVTQTGLLLLWISAIVTIYTGWDYFRAGIRHLIEEDEG